MFAFSLTFFTNPHLRRALRALGIAPRLGLPGRGDTVLVWGRRPVARRGMAIARWRGANVVTVEDGFLRSVRTGREGEPGPVEGAGPDLLTCSVDSGHPRRTGRR